MCLSSPDSTHVAGVAGGAESLHISRSWQVCLTDHSAVVPEQLGYNLLSSQTFRLEIDIGTHAQKTVHPLKTSMSGFIEQFVLIIIQHDPQFYPI